MIAKRLRKFLVEIFVGNTRKFHETVWAESREAAESIVDGKYARAGTVDITSINEIEADSVEGFESEPE